MSAPQKESKESCNCTNENAPSMSTDKSGRIAKCASYQPYNFVHSALEKLFAHIGSSIGLRPKVWILGSLLFILVASLGLVPMERVVDLSRSWWPRETHGIKQHDFVVDVYGDLPMTERFIAIARDKEPPGVLLPETIKEIIEINRVVVNLPDYNRLCIKSLSTDDVLKAVNQPSLTTPAGDMISLNGTLGTIAWGSGVNLTGAQAIHAQYPMNVKEFSKETIEEFEKQYIDALSELRNGKSFQDAAKAGGIDLSSISPSFSDTGLQHINLEFLATRSFDHESDSQVDEDTPLISVAVGVMVVYVSVALGGMPFKNSRILLALASVGSIGASLLCGFGIGGYFGNPFNVMSQLAIFIIMGIGVDDTFIIVDSFDRHVNYDSITERMSASLQQAGPAITLTSLTDFAAFLIGTTIPIPSIRQFATTAALSILSVFILQITLFSPCLILDNKRKEDSRYDVIFCREYSPNDSVKNSALSNRYTGSISSSKQVRADTRNRVLHRVLKRYYLPLFRNVAFRIFLVLIFLAGGGLGLYFGLKVNKGLEPQDFLAEGSHPREFMDASEEHFGGNEELFQWHFFHLPNANDIPSGLLPDRPSGVGEFSVQSVKLPPFENYMFRNGSENSLALQAYSKVYGWVDLGSVENRMAMRLAISRIRELDSVRKPVVVWFEEFEEWEVRNFLNETESFGTCVNLELLSSGEEFLRRSRSFLIQNPEFQSDVIWRYRDGSLIDQDVVYDEDSSVDTSEILIFAHQLTASHGRESDTQARLDRMDEMRLLTFDLDEAESIFHVKLNCSSDERDERNWNPDFLAFGFEFNHVWLERVRRIEHWTLFNLGAAAITVFVVVSLFQPLRNSFAVVLCVILTDIDILGLMYLWNLRLNINSMVVLVIAVGLSVDFAVHVAEFFLLSDKRCRTGRAADALANLGVSVLNGGISTFLGILMLAFTQSPIFQILFRMFFGLVVFGMLHGLIFLPALLSFIGPLMDNRKGLNKQVVPVQPMEKDVTDTSTGTAPDADESTGMGESRINIV